MCLHFASWAVQGTRGVERSEGWMCFLQIKINCWDFHAEWKVSERALCPFIKASTSSHCPINLFSSSLFFCWPASVFVIFISFILNSAFCIVKSCMQDGAVWWSSLSVFSVRQRKKLKEWTTRRFEFAHNTTTAEKFIIKWARREYPDLFALWIFTSTRLQQARSKTFTSVVNCESSRVSALCGVNSSAFSLVAPSCSPGAA